MHLTRAHIPQLETPQPGWHSGPEMQGWVEDASEGAASHTQIADLIFSPNMDLYTPPRTVIAMTTGEVEGEQVSGTAGFLNSQTRPEAALTHEAEKFVLAVLLNGFRKNSRIMASFWRRIRDGVYVKPLHGKLILSER